MPTVVRINKRMFNAIRNLHILGFIHRNIQPSNFAIGSQTQTAVVFIIGFSLASRIEIDPLTGDEMDIIKSSQQQSSFRRINTLNSIYMSRQCHISSSLNLTRMDDIESWLYQQIEITRGALPWRSLEEKNEVS